MKKTNLLVTLGLVLSMALTGCGAATQETVSKVDSTPASTEASTEASVETSEAASYTVGICNYVDDASLNQIVDNIKDRLNEIGTEKNVTFNVNYDNCNADANVLAQIVSNFQADKVDLMVGVATPVAIQMQSATEGTDTPVVFAAVSDPVGTNLVSSMDAPGANLTGTSDLLNTEAILNIMLANNPDLKKVGLLYDIGQDASTQAIADAKAFFKEKNIEVVDYTGTSIAEVMLAVDSMVADKVEAVFTPTDNTIMTAELSIYEKLAEAKIPHYAGADSFALNGAFLGFGVDYAALGRDTADMVADILLNEKDVASVPVHTFDNGVATVNVDICAAIGLDFETVKAAIAPFCTEVKEIHTAESFE
jgi:putative ABC transport system substrate-binding protein